MTQKRHTARDLLEPEVWDDLPLVGAGFTARVYRSGRYAVKVAHPGREARRRLAEEIAHFKKLKDAYAFVPRLYQASAPRGVLVRRFFALPTLYQMLLDAGLGQDKKASKNAGIPGIQAGSFQPAQPSPERDKAKLEQIVTQLLPRPVWAELYRVLIACRQLQQSEELSLDFSPSNIYIDLRRKRCWLGDLGTRLDPPLFAGVASASELVVALLDYPAFRARLDDPRRLRPFVMPPSGRFHVEVAVGRVPDARLLWVNQGLMQRLGLGWSRGKLEGLGCLATHAPDPRWDRVATRYQDSPGTGEGEAQGDGRVIYLGQLDDVNGVQREFTLKGCGSTPLAWQGHQYHFDGFVSFARTLWETAICDELARLGFDSSEVLAIFSTGRTTVDNTEREWPAAAALRVTRSHFRLGHLRRWDDDPDAMRAMLNHIGRAVLRPDFSAASPAHLRRLVLQLAHRLGQDAGRSDALCIHCFNPTMGNIRVDGHFIDFSTVRFQRHYLPTYQYLDGKRSVRDHRAAPRKQIPSLLQALVKSGLLDENAGRMLASQAQHGYDAFFEDGFIAGLALYLGLEDLPGRPAARARLVDETQHLRMLRAQEQIAFPFWQQRHAAPLYDLQGRMPNFIEAWRRGEARPWQALRSDFSGEVDDYAEHAGRAFFEALQRLLPVAQLKTLQARRIDQIVRPCMLNTELVSLCYEQSTPEQFASWQRHLCTSWYRPRPQMDDAQAQAAAQQAGHLAFPLLSTGKAREIVGMDALLYEAVCDSIERVVGSALVGALACGTRISTRARLRRQLVGERHPLLLRPGGELLREDGPDPRRSSPLKLLVFVRAAALSELGDVEDRLAAALRGLGAAIPLLPVGYRGRTLVETALATLEEAARDYFETPRGDAHPAQCVLFFDAEAGRPVVSAR